MDFARLTDDELKENIEAIELALNVPPGNPYEGREARLRQDLDAAKAEMEKRTARPRY